MKRAIVIIGFVLLAFTAITSIGSMWLFQTKSGQNFTRTQIENQLQAAFRGPATLAEFSGAPPGQIILHDLVLYNEEIPWLSLKTAKVTWRPFALLRRKVIIDLIEIDGLAMLDAPPPKPKEPDETYTTPKAPELPERLPYITLNKFSVKNAMIGEALLGDEVRFHANGALEMGSESLSAQLSLQTDDKKDQIAFNASLKPNEVDSLIKAHLISDPDGTIASLSKIDGSVNIKIDGKGPLEGMPIFLSGDIGAYGDATADIVLTLIEQEEKPRGLSVTGSAKLGSALDILSKELGSSISFDARFNERGRGGELLVSALKSDALDISGQAEWRNDSGGLKNAKADFSANFSPDHLQNIQIWVGDEATLTFFADRQKGAYTVNSILTSPIITAQLQDIRTDFQKKATGAVTIAQVPHEAAPSPLQDGFALSASLDYNREKAIADDIRFLLGEESVVSGIVAYGLKNNILDGNVAVNLRPQTIASLLNDANADTPLYLQLSVKGPLDDLHATADGQIPLIRLTDGSIPASNFKVDIKGLPKRPNGVLDAKSIETIGRLSAIFRSTAQDVISLQELQFVGDDFAFAGDGALDERSKSLALNITYRGGERATPFPGMPITGQIDGRGQLHWGQGVSDYALAIKNLRAGEAQIVNGAITAKGPSGALAIASKIDRLDLSPTNSLRNISVNVAVKADDEAFFAITGLGATYNNTNFALTKTATLSLDDGVKLNNVVAKIGDSGAAQFNGSFTNNRWQAEGSLYQVPISIAAAVVSAEFKLDTNKPTMARGNFAVRADTADEDLQDAIAADFIWSDKTLSIKSLDEGAALLLDLQLPLALTRSPALGLSTEGNLSGALRYDGPIAPFIAFAPEEIQGFEGNMSTNLIFGGRMNAPTLDGSLRLENGAYTELTTGLSLVGITIDTKASVANGETTVTIDGGARGEGQKKQTIAMTGALSIGEESKLDAEIVFDDARFTAEPVKSLRLRGGAQLGGPLDALIAKGEIIVDAMNIEIVTPEMTGLVPIHIVSIDENGREINSTTEPPLSMPIDLDIALTANNKIFLRGRGLESEWSAKVKALTIEEQPILLGGIDLRRGTLDFSGRRFELTQGEITFDKLSPNNPIVDLRAEYQTEDNITATIVIAGRATTPSITLESTPSLPKEDIMALVLFGKPANELSAVESLQMAQALASLGGIGPFGGGGGLTGSAREALGLDLLNVDLDTETGASALTVGKYVAEGLFVSATQDVKGEKGSVRIEYEVRDNVSVETELEQNGDQTVSANWKYDF